METKTKSKPKPEPEPEPEPSIKRDEIEAFYGRCAPGTSAFKLPIQLEEGQALYGAAHPSLGQPPPVHVALTSQVREDQAEGRGRAGGQVRRGQPARDGPQEVPRKGGRVGVPGPRTAPPLCARCGRRRREPQGVIHTACCAACCAAQVRLGFPAADSPLSTSPGRPAALAGLEPPRSLSQQYAPPADSPAKGGGGGDGKLAEVRRLYGTYNPEKLPEVPALAAKYVRRDSTASLALLTSQLNGLSVEKAQLTVMARLQVRRGQAALDGAAEVRRAGARRGAAPDHQPRDGRHLGPRLSGERQPGGGACVGLEHASRRGGIVRTW